jgi:aryl-alcohol dehydrogenase-like predicted oxidoreductase
VIPDHENGSRTIRRALDPGINFIDTADVYPGESEEIVAKAKSRR